MKPYTRMIESLANCLCLKMLTKMVEDALLVCRLGDGKMPRSNTTADLHNSSKVTIMKNLVLVLMN